MRTNRLVWTGALFSLAFSGVALGDGTPADLIARRASEAPAMDLPGRAVRASYAPGRMAAPRVEKVHNPTHPALPAGIFVPGDVLELQGRDLGTNESGRVVKLVGKSPASTVTLRVLNWEDKFVRVQIPELYEMGVDDKELAALEAKLKSKKVKKANKRSLGFDAQVGIMLGDQWVGGIKKIHIVAVGTDIDGDGHAPAPWGKDCDDFDARRSPDFTEVADPEDLDEDCNPETVIKDELDLDGDL